MKRLGRIFLIETADLGDERCQDVLVRRLVLARRVWEIAQEDELRSRIRIGQIVQLQALELVPRVMDISHERRHDDGGPALFRNCGFEIELRQRTRRHEHGDEPEDAGDGQCRRREQHDDEGQCRRQWCDSTGCQVPGRKNNGRRGGGNEDCGVEDGGVAKEPSARALSKLWPAAD